MFATSSGLQTRPSGIEPKIFSRRFESEPSESPSTLASLSFVVRPGARNKRARFDWRRGFLTWLSPPAKAECNYTEYCQRRILPQDLSSSDEKKTSVSP